MPLSSIDFSRRAPLVERMDAPCSRDELRACLRDLAKVNRWLLAYRPVLAWLDNLALRGRTSPIRIVDVGCGYGDTLRRVERWAMSRGIPVELTGVDLNPDATAIAAEAGGADSRIQWVTANVFSFSMPKPPHLVISSLFTHHLTDAEIVRFVAWMEREAVIGWLINDLSRAPIPYHVFRWFSRLTRLHAFVQHDGPVSVARSFVASDWRRLCAAAGLKDSQIAIRGFKPARLCVSRRKQT